MTATRPLFSRYRQILTALQDGPCFARDLVAQGINRPGMALPNLIASGCVERMSVRDVPDPSKRGPRPVWRYAVTDEGRAVLESGVVPCKVPGKNWNAGTPRRPKLVLDPARCVHYWLVGNDLQQSATCATCGATKEFRQPFPWEKKSALTRAVVASGDGNGSDYGNESEGGSGAYTARGAGSSETLSCTAEAG